MIDIFLSMQTKKNSSKEVDIMDLNERIKKDFGAIDNFKEHVKYTFIYIFFEVFKFILTDIQFKNMALGIFGSGWTW